MENFTQAFDSWWAKMYDCSDYDQDERDQALEAFLAGANFVMDKWEAALNKRFYECLEISED